MEPNTPQALAARCLMVGIPGPELDAETTERLESLDPAGVILFRRNLVDFTQTRELLRRAAECASGPPLAAIDQEGGRVSRLAHWIGATPSAMRLAAAGAGAARSFGEATGRALRSLSVNLDFAPVVDLSSPDAANGIADRAYGVEPDTVVRLAGAFLDGLQGAGVAGCLKHFPGLGPTTVDSHLELPTVERDRAALEREDLLPFRLLAGRAASIMVGHGHYPAFDGAEPRPATCSPTLVEGLLRRSLGFQGVIVSDDLEMGAVAGRDGAGAAAVAALEAGCDLLLYCADLERARRAAGAIAAAIEARPALGERVREAAERVRRLALRFRVDRGDDLARWTERLRGFERFRDLA